MTNTTKAVIAFGAVAGVFGLLAFFGVTPFLQIQRFVTNNTQQLAGTSPAGSTFNDSKLYSQQITTGTTTAFSILNSSSNQTIVKTAEVILYGGISTTTNYNIECATSTSPSSFQGNTNWLLNMNITGNSISLYGTTTGAGMYMSSSSPGQTGVLNVNATAGSFATTTIAAAIRTIPSGAYLDCQVITGDGSNYFNANVAGTISFPYNAQ